MEYGSQQPVVLHCTLCGGRDAPASQRVVESSRLRTASSVRGEGAAAAFGLAKRQADGVHGHGQSMCAWLVLLLLAAMLMLEHAPCGVAHSFNTGLLSPVWSHDAPPPACNATQLPDCSQPGRDVPSCVMCQPGEYCRAPNDTLQAESGNASFVCEPCPAGCYQDEHGQHQCLVCHGGNATAACNKARCGECNPGHFSARDGRPHLDCEECAVGTNQTHPGNGSCHHCPLSTMCNVTACTDCLDCPSGFESNRNASDCQACAPGRYRGLHMDKCWECDAGTACNLSACHFCIDCIPGHAARPGKPVCAPCSLGHYQDRARQAVCHKCPRGHYAVVMGSKECRVCAAGSYCPTADNPPIECPSDAYCPEGSEAPQYCPTLYSLNSNKDGCAMSGGLIGIIAATVMANVVIITLLVWYYYRKKRLYTGETQPLVWRKDTLSKDPPVYDGF